MLEMPRTGLSAEEIRARAIDATVVTMRREGFDKVRLTEIAKQLGVSHAALYTHFEDKAALLDAVSERWLVEIDASLDAICKKSGKSPHEKLLAWMTALHRAKRDKVLNDPELYKSFDVVANAKKPYVQRHIAIMREQLVALMGEAIAKKRRSGASAETMADIVWEAMMSFHHPKLVANHIDEKREPLMKLVLESVLSGLGL
jgi:AcrR family transcriptional regulator